MSCDLQSLDSGLSIAELKSGLPIANYLELFAHDRGIEEHMENENHEKYGDTRNKGTRGLQGEVKMKSLLWPHSTGTKGAKHLKYKRG